MASLYSTLTFDEKAAIRRVIDQYLDGKFDMRHLGKATYDSAHLVSVDNIMDYTFYFNSKKLLDIEAKHHLTRDQILSIIVNRRSYKIVGKLRDKVHEITDSEDVVCIDEILRRESRWCKFFTNANGHLMRVVYNLRIHVYSSKSVLGVITYFPIDVSVIETNTHLYNSYLRAVDSFKRTADPMRNLILEMLHIIDPMNGGAKQMKYKKRSTGEIVDLDRHQVYELSLNEAIDLDPYGYDAYEDAAMAKLNTILSYYDSKKMQYYYEKGDIEHDPNGSLREQYIGTFSFEPLNEANLLNYNHCNADIFNELLELKYREVGGQRKVDNNYTMTSWKEFCPAFRAVGYGYDQPIIYKNLCAAFGKDQVDQVWKKHYKFGINDGL